MERSTGAHSHSGYEVIENPSYAGQWHVEYISSTSGKCFVAVFTGPEALQRACEYAAWKNGGTGERRLTASHRGSGVDVSEGRA